MTIEIVFETHSTSTDNEAGVASGWRDPPLSAIGRQQARELGERRQGTVDAVFCSDLRRAVETATIAFGASVPVRHDRRLREYDYGDLTGATGVRIHAERVTRIDTPFPGGESFRDVVTRVRAFLDDLIPDCDGKRVLVIGHVATHGALEHLLAGVPLEEAGRAPFAWRPGWRYALDPSPRPV